MKAYSEIATTQKPENKIADYVGKTIEIQDISSNSIEMTEKDGTKKQVTFNQVTLTDGTVIAINPTMAKQIRDHEKELPFSGLVSERRAKLGKYYFLA
jgi:hypothetical protein